MTKLSRNLLILVVLGILLSMCIYTRAPEAFAATRSPGIRFQVWAQHRVLFTTGGTCYRWRNGRRTRDGFNEVQYAYGFVFEACTNADHSQMAKVRTKLCYRVGGYAIYKGCFIQASSPPAKNLYVHAQWHFQLGIAGIGLVDRYPHVNAWVYPNGLMKGVFYNR